MKIAPDPCTSTVISMPLIKDTSYSEDVSNTLSFHNINYIVNTSVESDEMLFSRQFMGYCRRKEQKQILFNVSGRFTRGLNAILGKLNCIFSYLI